MLNRRGLLKAAGAGAVLASAGLSLTGCGRSAGGPDGDLRVVLANHVWTTAIRKRIPEFSDLARRRVLVSTMTADQLSSTYNVKLNASAPDVDVMMYRPLQEQLLFARNGWLADLTDRVSAQPGYDWADFQPASRERTTVQGKVFGVPVVTERPALYYRRDLVPDGRPPATLAEMFETAARLHNPAAGLHGFVGRGQRAAAVSMFSSYLYSFGGAFTVDQRSGVGTPEAIAAYQYYGRLLREAGPIGATNMSLEQITPIFAQGKAVFAIDADAVYRNFIDPATSLVGDRTGFGAFPAGPAGSRPFNVPSWGLTINAFSERRDAAWEFIRWATSPEMVLALQAEGVPGARLSAWRDRAALAKFPPDLAASMTAGIQTGVGADRPDVVQVGRARDIVGRPLVASILGADVVAAAVDASQQLDAFLVRDARQRKI
ncbi:MAG TPA: extracellular solute-binding protein [Pseudonocardia sp.]|uniref:extracellular solute-binding protein n=1 Tax=Pseudonocardia sp. TaxID=60912 RepID=UPI002C6019A8|nr:extracellular solute-binding protein [Pseudonocardia sp.]HTF54941.1 extracellular solute-binding protein [Pseudonocardia sp.]